jgi:hypothetical protein
MKPTVEKVTDLFELQRRLVVPLFQRSYVWNLQEQWVPLWRDILRQAKRVLQTPTGAPLPPDATHFLGAIVVQSEAPAGDGRPPMATIIDGQQRLVTLQILLAAVGDELRSSGDSYLGQIEALTHNHRPHVRAEDEFKVWPTNRDRDSFRIAMTIGSTAGLVATYGGKTNDYPPLLQAYRYFADEMRTYLTADHLEDDDDDGWHLVEHVREERVRALITTFRQCLRFVVIQLDEKEDPQIIFESLNARGAPLLPSDLIKNYVFLEAGDNAEAFYGRYWAHFENGDWLKKIPKLSVFRDREMIDVFFRTYLVETPNRPEVNINQLYLEFRDWRTKTRGDRPIEKLLADVHRKAAAFEDFVGRRGGSQAQRLFDTILATDDFVAAPLIMHVLARDLLPQTRDACLAWLESFIVRRWFCEGTRRNQSYARNQAHVYANILNGLRDASDAALDTTLATKLLTSQSFGKDNWPKDDEFKYGWGRKKVYVETRYERAVLILTALERALGSMDTGQVESCEVEHVLPLVADESVYPYPMPGGHAVNSERREALVDTIGNITLLEKTLNKRASNRSFAQKRPLYSESGFHLNRDFVKQDSWDEDRIAARANALFDLAKQIWPRSQGN